ncbi:MAG: TIGR00299 family protein [Desulfobulbaceae bacterium A2]|nr:MAG: TIGR00299 family protein [Desulfobulbaceae bacterium A2]
MSRIAYCDCFSGISGDMLLGALLDAGLAEGRLRELLGALPLEGWSLEVELVNVQGLQAHRVRVQQSHGAHHHHRHLRDIQALLETAPLAEGVRQGALAVFRRLAAAESTVHGCAPEDVHFHEVGAVDAIVDVVGAVAGLAELGVTELWSSALPLSRGWVECAHGWLPLPAPAVCALLHDVPVQGLELEQELVTPTGAAILRGLDCRFGPLPRLRLEAVGYGAGSSERRDGRPNLLRLLLGSPVEAAEAAEVEVIETQLDDMLPELWPHVAERLLAHGALDVALCPLLMKKGRPGFLVRVVCDPAHGQELKRLLLSETSAIGLRYRRESRWTLPRRAETVSTPWGPVLVKRIDGPAGPVLTPEYEDCRRLALTAGVPLRSVYAAVARHGAEGPDEAAS